MGLHVAQEIRAHAEDPAGRRELADLAQSYDDEIERILDSIWGLLASGVLAYEERSVDSLVPSQTAVEPVALADLAEEAEDEIAPTHSVAIELIGEDDEPIPHAAYRLLGPDGKTHTGRLDQDGRAEVHGLKEAGDCKICFPDFDSEAWEYISAMPL